MSSPTQRTPRKSILSINKELISLLEKHLIPDPEKAREIKDKIDRNGHFNDFSPEEIKKFRCMIFEESKWKQRWDIFIILIVFYNVILTPINLAFETIMSSKLWTLFETFLDLFFIMDLLLNFRTIHINTKGKLITNQKEIALNYLTSWFFVDLLASFPMDLIFFFQFNDASTGKIFSLVKTLRLLRLGRVFKFLDRIKFANFVRLLKIFFLFYLTMHWVACFWVMVEGLNFELENESFMVQYSHALYEGSLILFKSRVDTNKMESSIYQFVVIFFSATFNAIIFSSIAVRIQNSDTGQNKIREKMDVINEYMDYNEIPSQTQDKIRDYFEFMALISKSDVYQEKVTDLLPDNIRKRYLLQRYSSVISKLKVLKYQSPAFSLELISKATIKVYPIDSYIAIQGEVATGAEIIVRGSASVLIEGDKIKQVSTGDSIGITACFLRSSRSPYTIRVSEYIEAFYIPRETLLCFYSDFYDDMEILKEKAQKNFKVYMSFMSDSLFSKLITNKKGEVLREWWVPGIQSQTSEIIAEQANKKMKQLSLFENYQEVRFDDFFVKENESLKKYVEKMENERKRKETEADRKNLRKRKLMHLMKKLFIEEVQRQSQVYEHKINSQIEKSTNDLLARVAELSKKQEKESDYHIL